MLREADIPDFLKIEDPKTLSRDGLTLAFTRGFVAEIEKSDEFAAFQEKYRYDPAGFVRDCFSWAEDEGPTKYQLEILEQIVQRKRISVRGARGLGKSAMLSWIFHWFALTSDGEDWKIILTASQFNQLRDYLWPEIHKWSRKLNWRVIGRKAYGRNELLQRTLKLSTGLSSTSSPATSGGIEGAHAERVLFMFDESKNVRDEVFDSAEGTFSGAGGDTGRVAYVCAFSTPGPPTGRFSDIHHRRSGLENWMARHVTLEETIRAGRVSLEWAEQMERLWGVDSALYQNHVLGEFAAVALNSVIPLAWVEAAVERWHDLYPPDPAGGESLDLNPSKLTRIGVDVGGGVDDTVLALRFGRAVKEIRASKQGDQEIIAGQVLAIAKAHNENAVAVVDAIGVGSGVQAILRKRMKTAPFGAGEKTTRLDAAGEFGFPDKRSAAWWNMRELLDPNSGEDIALPPDERLLGELILPAFEEIVGGKIRVESKKTIKSRNDGRSTDYADAVIQAFWREPMADRKKRTPRAGRAGRSSAARNAKRRRNAA